MTQIEQKILNFMLRNPQLDYLASEIQKSTNISKAGIHLALKNLIKQGLATRQKRGKTYFYSVDFDDSRIKEFKKLNNIGSLKSLTKKLSKYALKIVLFGSAGRGENLQDSDFDLFILTRTPQTIQKIISKNKNLQVIIKTPLEYIKFEKENPSFSQEINNGLILWQQH